MIDIILGRKMMANPMHVKILRQGTQKWNKWRKAHPEIQPDLSGYDLARLKKIRGPQRLEGPDSPPGGGSGGPPGGGGVMSEPRSKLSLNKVNLAGANLQRAIFTGKYLNGADLSNADLRKAQLNDCLFNSATFKGADLREVNLKGAKLIRTDMSRADLSGAFVYGISVWDVNFDGAIQKNLIITRGGEPAITLDNLEVAQFVHLLLQNPRVRGVIDTITQKVVLILGRFTLKRKTILDAIRKELRRRDYVPILFDFKKPSRRSTVETVTTLAGMARFVIADLTDAKSVLQELQAIVPDLPNVPVQPLLISSQSAPGMLDYFKRFPWFLNTYRYDDLAKLLGSMKDVIAPAEKMARQLTS
jgi:uncharacterized protein YjbI with pentapeptide repeats